MRVLTKEELSARRKGVSGADAQAAKLAECGYVPLAFLNDGWFTWLCPGCGYFSHGQTGHTAVGGWINPRWTVSGLPNALTLEPSLGCPRWRDGSCIGHWWCRNGELIAA